MKTYESVDLSEAQLEDLMRQGPGLIEEGLRYVDHQRRTSDGRLDVLLVDSGGAIVVAELKVKEEDGILLQGLDYYDYVTANREALARVYASAKIDPMQPARLLLVAPSFPMTLLNRVKWFKVPISLFTYRCIRFADGPEELIPVYTEVKPAPTVESIPTRSVDEILRYITDDVVRGKANEILGVIRDFGPAFSMDPVQGAVSLKRQGRVVAYLWVRRKWFVFGRQGIDGKWVYAEVESGTDLAPIRAEMEAVFVRAPNLPLQQTGAPQEIS